MVMHPHAPAAQKPVPVPEASGPRILIVEDHSDARLMLSFALRKLGFEVLSTASGAAALTTVRDKRPSVVVLDIGLEQGPDGLEVCKRIRSGKHGDAPCVVITSGRGDSATVEQARTLGANAYFTKPYRLSRLLEIVSAPPGPQDAFILELRP